jgi:hypothetical protein
MSGPLLFNSLGTEMNLHMRVGTSQRTWCVNIRKTNQSVLYWGIITMYCKHNLKRTNARVGKMQHLVMLHLVLRVVPTALRD